MAPTIHDYYPPIGSAYIPPTNTLPPGILPEPDEPITADDIVPNHVRWVNL